MLLTYCFNIGSVEDAMDSPYPFGTFRVRELQWILRLTAHFTSSLHLPECGANCSSHNSLYNSGARPSCFHHDQRSGINFPANFRLRVSAIDPHLKNLLISYSRDNGLPFSHWIRRVSPRYRIPVNSILVSIVFTTALSLVNLGSTVAFSAVLSLATVALMATYVLSIGCVTLRRLYKEPLPRARWPLGRMGLPINCLALFYASWSCFWSFWPIECNVTSADFNWACVLFVGLMAFSWLLYQCGAKTTYHGPVSKVQEWMNDW